MKDNDRWYIDAYLDTFKQKTADEWHRMSKTGTIEGLGLIEPERAYFVYAKMAKATKNKIY